MMVKNALFTLIIISLCAFSVQEKSLPLKKEKKIEIYGGVTNIKVIVNKTLHTISVGKTENKEFTGVIQPGGVWSGDMWIPWANNKAEFKDHHMWVTVNKDDVYPIGHMIEHFIWQSGEFVRAYRANIAGAIGGDLSNYFIPNARPITGESSAGGNRKLTVFQDANGGGGLKVMLEKL